MCGVVLLTMARSRSSMTAEIFRRHGVFFGQTRRPEDGGIGYNENLALKRLARSKRRGDSYDMLLERRDPTVEIPSQWWLKTLEDEGYIGGPWGMKVDAFCRAEGTLIGIRRNPDAIVASCMRVLKKRPEEDWRRIVAAHHEELARLDIPTINTDQLVDGDYSSLERAMKACGLEHDPDVTESVIWRTCKS